MPTRPGGGGARTSWRRARTGSGRAACSTPTVLTARGRAARGDIEDRTDAAVAPALAVLGDDLDELLATIEPWGAAIRDAGGYLTPLVRFTFAT